MATKAIAVISSTRVNPRRGWWYAFISTPYFKLKTVNKVCRIVDNIGSGVL